MSCRLEWCQNEANPKKTCFQKSPQGVLGKKFLEMLIRQHKKGKKPKATLGSDDLMALAAEVVSMMIEGFAMALATRDQPEGIVGIDLEGKSGEIYTGVWSEFMGRLFALAPSPKLLFPQRANELGAILKAVFGRRPDEAGPTFQPPPGKSGKPC